MHRNGFYLIAFLLMPLVVGCEGCRPAGTNAESEEESQLPKEAFTTEPPEVYPADQSSLTKYAKPGHWMTAEQSIRSNKVDSRGELKTRSSVSVKNLELENTGTIESRESIRPLVLPKGQMRRFDFRFRCPSPNTIETRQMSLLGQFIPRSGAPIDIIAQRVQLMPSSEYFFVVLTNRPEKFTRIQVANWASITDPSDSSRNTSNYQVVVPKSGQLLPLPETMLDMSSIAVVLWDDLSEDALTPLQQTALADWVRYGGRLVINGADGSDAVANTMLGDMLPLTPTSNIELNSDAAVELLSNWSVKSDRSLNKQVQFVRSEVSSIAVDGQLSEGAEEIPDTGKLVLQKRVGRGRVVQPRFDLTDDWIESWNSYDSFVNGAILGRPAREYDRNRYYDPDLGEAAPLYFAGTKIRSDAAVNTHFRLITRDAILGGADEKKKQSSSRFDPYHRVDPIAGVAAWNDRSDSIELMRDTLTQEAGIEIPGSELVVRSLAMYLIVLVPLNYLVFRLMNRLEYAWFAVPVIALIGAAWAARQARLDIGFATSNSELALLECHSGYPRAHLTRVIGIYNSLSDSYEMQFRTVDGIAARLDNEPDPGTTVEPLFKTSYEEGPSLANFAVPSNRMRYVHTEEMVELGGSLVLDENGQLTNETDLDLKDAVLVQRSEKDLVQVAVIGDFSSGAAVRPEYRTSDRTPVPTGLPMQADRLLRRYASPQSFAKGDTRLIARVDASLEGLELSPGASQSKAQTIVVIHLDHGDKYSYGVDRNLIQIRANRLDDASEDATDQSDAESSE